MDRRQFLVRSGLVSLGGFLSHGCGGSDGGSSPGTGAPSLPPVASPSPLPPLTGDAPVVIVLVGASSAVQYVSRYQGPASNARVQVTRDGTGLATLQSGAFGKVAGQAIVQATGRNVIFIDGGESGATLAAWAAAGSPLRQRLVGSIRTVGGASLVMLQAGWNDAANGSIRNRDDHLAMFRSLIGSIRAEAGIPDVPVLLGGAQNILEASGARQGQLAIQRLVEQDAVARIANVSYAFSTYDLPTVDGIHQAEQGQLLAGQRFAEHAIARLAGRPLPHGPRMAQARRVSSTVTHVRVDVNGDGGSVPASGINGFFVQQGTRQSVAAASAVRTDGSTVEVTHGPLDIGQGTIRYALDSPLGPPGCLRDTSALASPMEPGSLPIV